MISRYSKTSQTRSVYAVDGKTLIAVHGYFCFGCSASRGTCGQLTDVAIASGRITDSRALETIRIAKEFVGEIDAHRAGFGS
jgi:hypothetical protein